MRPSKDQLLMTVVDAAGARTDVEIDADEYARVIKHLEENEILLNTYAHWPYLGKTKGGLPYRLMIGKETLVVSFRGDGGTRATETAYFLTAKHVKGGMIELLVTKAEYEALLGFVADVTDKSEARLGTDAQGFRYWLRVGSETFSLTLGMPLPSERLASRE